MVKRVTDNWNSTVIIIHLLDKTMRTYNLEMSMEKTKAMSFYGSDPVRAKIILNDYHLKQVLHFKYLGYELDLHKHVMKGSWHCFSAFWGL